MVADGTARPSQTREEEREEKFKQAAGEVMQGILSVKDGVSLELQAVPQAALALTSIYFALQVDLLIKGKIAGQAKLEAGFTQIGRNLNIPQTIVQSVSKRLETAPFEVNKPRPERPTVITSRAARALLRYVRLNPKTTWVKLKRDTGLDVDRNTLRRTLEAHGISL